MCSQPGSSISLCGIDDKTAPLRGTHGSLGLRPLQEGHAEGTPGTSSPHETTPGHCPLGCRAATSPRVAPHLQSCLPPSLKTSKPSSYPQYPGKYRAAQACFIQGWVFFISREKCHRLSGLLQPSFSSEWLLCHDLT